MKAVLFLFAVVFSIKSSAQTTEEKKLLELSGRMFQWEIEMNTDSLASLFDEKLNVVNSRGEIQNKEQYLNTLRNGTFKHDSIDVEQRTATVENNSAIVIGKGRFAITLSGKKLHRHLSYMEAFTKDDKGWKLLAIYASALPD